MSLDTSHLVDIKPRTRAALTNGSLLPAGTDGRSACARRWRDLVGLLSREITAEGELTAAQLILVKQAALVTLRTEQLQADAVSGAPIDDNDLVRLSNSAARLFTALAKQRTTKPRNVPSIAEHFARKRAQA